MDADIRELYDEAAVAPLLSAKAGQSYPFWTPTSDAWPAVFAADKRLAAPATWGLYESGQLRAAALCGVYSGSESVDFGLVRPGDGVVSWLVASSHSTGEKLLAHCLARLPQRCFVCPEFGGLRQLTVFRTGMLPSAFADETAVLSAKLQTPATDAWGPQERYWLKLDMSDRVAAPVFPQGGELQREAQDELASTLRWHAGGQVVGECRISPATLGGKVYSRHVYVDWLGVDEAQRGKGLGQSLLLEQLRWACAQSATTALLTTHSGRPAHQLYRRLGFAIVGTARTYVTRQTDSEGRECHERKDV